MESRFVDWWEAFKGCEWSCVGRAVMEDCKGEYSDDNPEGLEGDDYIPMYNYAYPLEITPDEDTIFRICDETACTVVYNTNEDAYYLALCGCGMDMSQTIALAYMIAHAYGEEKFGRIPNHMLFDVYKSGALSVGNNEFKVILEKLEEVFKQLKNNCEREIKTIKH